MQKCWRQVPELRPTMEYITIKLENLEKTYDNVFEYASDTAATEIRKQLLNTGDDTDAEIILGRMKTECLDAFRDGARRDNLRCMKNLADYG